MNGKLLQVLICIGVVVVLGGYLRLVLSYPQQRVVEGCEYIVTWSGYGEAMTHKGNCTNSIHQHEPR